MSEPKKPHLPIGYWLKQADELLTRRINEAQRANGLNRTDWQILNVLQEAGSATDEQLATSLQPFASAAALREAVAALSQRGLVAGHGSADDGYTLTMQGERIYETALASQKEVRQRSMKGISEVDYATTVRVLQLIVENLRDESTVQ